MRTDSWFSKPAGLVLWYAGCSFRTACLLQFAFCLLGITRASKLRLFSGFPSLLLLPTSQYKPDLCTLCKCDANYNWLYTISHHCDSCLTSHLYWCIKLSHKFLCDSTTPCQTAEDTMNWQNGRHDKCYTPPAWHTSLCMKEGRQMMSFY